MLLPLSELQKVPSWPRDGYARKHGALAHAVAHTVAHTHVHTKHAFRSLLHTWFLTIIIQRVRHTALLPDNNTALHEIGTSPDGHPTFTRQSLPEHCALRYFLTAHASNTLILIQRSAKTHTQESRIGRRLGRESQNQIQDR